MSCCLHDTAAPFKPPRDCRKLQCCAAGVGWPEAEGGHGRQGLHQPDTPATLGTQLSLSHIACISMKHCNDRINSLTHQDFSMAMLWGGIHYTPEFTFDIQPCV